MNTKTYDRNLIKGLALIADEDYLRVRYVPLFGASSLVEDISFNALRGLHQAAYGLVGEANPDFNPSEWVRYSEHLELNQKYNVNY